MHAMGWMRSVHLCQMFLCSLTHPSFGILCINEQALATFQLDKATKQFFSCCTGSQQPIPSGPLAACLQMLSKRALDQGTKQGQTALKLLPNHAITLITAFSQLFSHLTHDKSVPAPQQQGESLQAQFLTEILDEAS